VRFLQRIACSIDLWNGISPVKSRRRDHAWRDDPRTRRTFANCAERSRRDRAALQEHTPFGLAGARAAGACRLRIESAHADIVHVRDRRQPVERAAVVGHERAAQVIERQRAT
jgi:hypothetical protein